MSDLINENQKMVGQLSTKKKRSIKEILKDEPPTFSGISIIDNDEIFPFLRPLEPIRYHLDKVRQFYEKGLSPVLSMSLLDNCVGQNKSQVVMKFFCMLSVLFYDTVALLYFLPGHSHMIPDRIVAHCKLAIKGLNLYTLGQIADHCSRIKNLQAE